MMMPELVETLFLPNERPILELDELWSFVLKKVNKRWIWIAPLSANEASCGFCHRRPFDQNLSARCGEKSRRHFGEDTVLQIFGKRIK